MFNDMSFDEQSTHITVIDWFKALPLGWKILRSYLRGVEVCVAVLVQLPLVVIQGDVLRSGKRKYFR